MSDNETGSPTTGPNKAVIALLGVVVVLLAVIVAIIVIKPGAKSTSTAVNTGTAATAGTDTGSTGVMPSLPATDVPFDKATATKLASGVTPEQHVKAYFDAVVAGDFAKAYALLPADKKAAQDEATFAAQLKGYGVQSYKIDDVKTTATGAEITATATMGGGDFQYLWTFVKDGDTWYLKSRTLPGMGG